MEEQELLNKYESNPDKKLEALNKLMSEQKEELKKFDMSLVVQLDQKVTPKNDGKHFFSNCAVVGG